MDEGYLRQFEKIGYESFRKRASNESLSKYEKIGFPDEYREGKEKLILHDMVVKLESLRSSAKSIADIGCGCSDLPRYLADHCGANGSKIYLLDSEEMLSQLPDMAFAEKIPCYFPAQCDQFIETHRGAIDAVIAYSVLHYVFVEMSIYRFVDACLSLLTAGGEILLGDIPNISRRKRFFSSKAGIAYHQQYTGKTETPDVNFNQLEPDAIDDAVVISILSRCRAQGFDAFVLPQDPRLPMANRREDIYIRRP